MGRPVDASFGDRSTIRLYELPMVSVSKTVAGRARRTSRTPMGVTRPALFILCFVLGAAAPGSARGRARRGDAFARLHNPDLLVASRELTIASGELTRANYWSRFNPLFVTESIYRQRDHQSNSQDWRLGFSQELEIFGQKRLREKVAALGYREREAALADRFRLLAGEISQLEANLAIVRHGQSERAGVRGEHEHVQVAGGARDREYHSAAIGHPQAAAEEAAVVDSKVHLSLRVTGEDVLLGTAQYSDRQTLSLAFYRGTGF